jgi:hypothetical protein
MTTWQTTGISIGESTMVGRSVGFAMAVRGINEGGEQTAGVREIALLSGAFGRVRFKSEAIWLTDRIAVIPSATHDVLVFHNSVRFFRIQPADSRQAQPVIPPQNI